jgi:cytochrome c peroxidase
MKKSFVIKYSVLLAIFFIAFHSCEVDPAIKQELSADNIQLSIPDNWPYPHYDFTGNELTKEKFILGRKLFYDKKVSRDNTVSCGTCHQQFASFSNFDHAVSHGTEGRLGIRNAPALFNLNWQTNFMWDGGVNHLELQPIIPITKPFEMDHPLPDLVAKLQNDAVYPKQFKDAFGTETITTQLIFKALAQFLGMLVSSNSKYDQYVAGQASFNSHELNGLKLFKKKCGGCHPAPLFTNYAYMNFGLDSVFNDPGRAMVTGLDEDAGTFKVPTVRNIALTRPYMHDGRFKTLEEVINHYSEGIVHSPTLSPELYDVIPLTNEEKQDIIAFLNTLTDNTFIKDERFSDPFAK